MARPKNPIPQARKHSSGQARVTIDGRDYYLGKYGTPEAEEAYRRIVAQWLAKEGPFNPKDDDPVTIQEITAGYWLYASKYYGYDETPHRGDCANLKQTIATVNRLYASLPAEQFGPLDLKSVIGEMVRIGWARSHVNHQLGRIKRIFKWATSEQMIPASVWHALVAVSGLKRGRTDANETEAVKPVDIGTVERTKKHLRPVHIAMIDFALLRLSNGRRPRMSSGPKHTRIVPVAVGQ